MRRLVLLAVLVGTASCSDAGFQLGTGLPDTDTVVTEVGGDTNDDEDAASEDGSIEDSGHDTSIVDSAPGMDSAPLDSGKFDSGKVDSGPFDSGKVDTGTFDSGTFDSGRADSGTFDSGTTTFDSGTFDSGTFDTGTFDSGTTTFDSGTFDSGTFDSGTFDTGGTDSTTGDGGMCPMPPSTVMPPSYEGYTCEKLQVEYSEKVQSARACSCDADCSKEVARDFCGCTLYVNPGNSSYPALGAIQDRYAKLSCLTICPASFCPTPVAGRCVTTTSGKVCAEGGLSGP
jgi:hypothetical protein